MDMGTTLMNEHIICDSISADYIHITGYNEEDILRTMVTYLI